MQIFVFIHIYRVDLDSDILKIFSKVLKIRSSINIYREINLFLRIQKYEFNSNIANVNLYPLLEIVINKIISSNYDGWDIHLLENNTLFGYLIEENNIDKYTNHKLINSFLLNSVIFLTK